MLIRVSGYNAGIKEYLEEGVKNGRDFSREELDERVILYGDLDVTDRVYKSIPDRGQNRYTTFTLSFREDEVSNETLLEITNEFREFIMYAYEEEEYNFYAEAHLPKIKEVFDKRTGERIDRKPHIHIVVPKTNLLSGKVSDVIGDPNSTERYLEAFQEYVNQKYNLASPREHIRVNPYNAADVLSRYKGDDFRGKNREFKEAIVKEIIDSDIRSRQDFYRAVSKHGETRIRNQGKENEYIAVKIPGDEKFTNLKETIFNDSFLIDRKLKKPPLAKHIISERLHEWPMRSKEIKYIAKASKSVRESYYQHSDINEKVKTLSDEQFKFYEKFGGQNELHPSEWSGSDQRSAVETGRRWDAGVTNRVQGLSSSDVAADRQARIATGAVFLPGNARVYVERPAAGGDSGLRPDLYVGGTGGTEAHRERAEAGREGRTGAPAGAGEPGETAASRRAGTAASTTGREGGAEETGEGREGTEPAGAESAGGFGEGRAGADQGREKTAEIHLEAGSADQYRAAISGFPNDAGSREAFRFTGVPELGRSDATFTVRGGLSGAGNRQLGIPVYARNARKIVDVTAIEHNSRRLFSDSIKLPAPKQSQAKLIRRVMPRVPKNASYVAACLQRRQEQNSLSGSQRSALYQADQKFFQTRRLIISDNRLSTKDKTQLLGVLMFERLKAHQMINQPQRHNQQEYQAMSSEDIKSKIKPEPKYRNTISGAEETEKGPQDAKQRFRNMAKQVEENLGERSLREKVRIITAADLYTRKAKLSDNIHYLDKSSDKTLFIDTGKSIAVSKNGLSDSAVAVALELAKEKFGSTLTVKGTKAFKDTAIEVVAQKGLDIHFSDKEMNRRLAERKAELAIEREGQNITAGKPAVETPTTTESFREAFRNVEKQYESIQDNAGKMSGEEIYNKVQEVREQRKELTLAYLGQTGEDDGNRLDERSRSLEADLLEVSEVKIKANNQDVQGSEQPSDARTVAQRPTPVSHEGVLLEHGKAPYNFTPDLSKPEDERDDSYYVKLQGQRGREKLVWGVTLEQAVQGLEIGERVSLTNLGKEKVEWEQQLANGKTEHRQGERVAWEGKPLDRDLNMEVEETYQYETYEQYQSMENDGPSVA
ncbi:MULTISPECIES: LPD7 domain-containing protein [Enterobacterales]|uniref:LPD7 domain-containing protein n=2 Tax=Gammaproteobacteria TaxID=1236 RepID=UPI000C470970|nr:MULTISPECIES: LPD7 domain-containing protein [Enterobacterales]PIJ49357.1 hypothetical protein BV501_13030 [Erwinia sp. OAMSP11]